jgi:hypothetical protein
MPESRKPEGRFVKGSVLVDYVKLMRASPQLPWADHLSPADLEQLNAMILPASWYPVDLFQRLGLAVFRLLSKESFEVVRGYGRFLAEQMNAQNPGLMVKGRPRDTLNKFQVIQDRLFSYKVVEIKEQVPGRCIFQANFLPQDVGIKIYMEVTAATLGRLIEFSGGRNVRARVIEGMWQGGSSNVMELTWEEP